MRIGRCPICPQRLPPDDATVEGNIYLYNPKSLQIQIINWWAIIRVYYLKHIYLMLIAIFVAYLPTNATRYFFETTKNLILDDMNWTQLSLTVGLACIIFYCRPQWRSSVYLVDFVCANPPQSWKITREEMKVILNKLKKTHGLHDASVEFMERILNNSGIGDSTHWPPSIMRVIEEEREKIRFEEEQKALQDLEKLAGGCGKGENDMLDLDGSTKFDGSERGGKSVSEPSAEMSPESGDSNGIEMNRFPSVVGSVAANDANKLITASESTAASSSAASASSDDENQELEKEEKTYIRDMDLEIWEDRIQI